MNQRLTDLIARKSALRSASQVEVELVDYNVTHRSQRRDGDKTAVPHSEIRPPPQIAEHHLIRNLRKLR